MRRSLLFISFAALAFSTAARADISISNKPTQNMSCEAGVCTATAQKAVLNVGDLQTMLASGDVTVKTATVAKDIDIAQPLTWASTRRLTLDAQQSVIVNKQVTVSGTGALTIVTNDGGSNGEFIIVPERGSIQFWDLASSLIIDGQTYTLMGDIKTLAADIAANPSGFYALATPYDASTDGTYSAASIGTTFTGVFEGLGNPISNFSLRLQGNSNGGLFAEIEGVVRHVGLTAIAFAGMATDEGALVGVNAGNISRAWATGSMSFEKAGSEVGGLVGINDGAISYSFAKLDMRFFDVNAAEVGGLVGFNGGKISRSYADGSMSYQKAVGVRAGDLAGGNVGRISNCYARNAVKNYRLNINGEFGGLIGRNYRGQIVSSYAAGHYAERNGASDRPGGVVGEDDAPPGRFAASYWDLDKGTSDPSQGAGNIKDDPGITGLTTTQFQAGLPAGFYPAIWGQAPNINDGYPYLLANPPK